ncbi:MAG: putative toxin-antitoxin system toxin component, PIN family [Candidatus Bathyarchaeia archaeon]
MKITLDTNVLISALIINGKSRTLLFEIMRRKHELILSKEILEEFTEVSRDLKIRRYVNEEDAAAYLRDLASLARIVQIKSKFSVVKDDPDDDVILRTAHDGNAGYLVTGDKHLVKLKRFRKTRIVTVDEMLRILKSKLTE